MISAQSRSISASIVLGLLVLPLVLLTGSPVAWAQDATEADDTKTATAEEQVALEVATTLEEASTASTAFDRIEYFKSIRVPESMIEIAPAEEHFDLIVHNRFITTLRATVLANPPAARAEGIVEALSELAEQDRVSPIETYQLEQGMLFVVAGEPVFALVHKDLEPIAGETLDSRTTEALANLEIALEEMVELHNPENIIEGVFKNLVALLLFGLFVWILHRLKNWVDRSLLPSLDRRMRDSVSKRIGESAQREIRFISLLSNLATLLLWIGFLGVAYLWLTYSLEQFPYTRPWGEALGQHLVDLLAWFADGIARAIPGLFVVAVVFFFARAGSRLIQSLFEAVEKGRLELPGLHRETAQPTRRLINTAIWLVALVVAYPYLPGSSTAAFKGLSVFLGLVISLGSTGIVNQAMSGLMVMYSRAVRPGDFVHIGTVEGTVTHLGMLSTKVRTLRNEEVTVPNAVVISRETINYSRLQSEGVAISTTVTIGYDTPWRLVHSLLEAAAERTPGLREDPKPFVLQSALSDYYPEYRLLAVIDRPEKRGRVLSTLHENIQDLFHKNGVQIMSPHYVADPPQPIIGDTEQS